MYLSPLRLTVGIGPNKSMWSSCSGQVLKLTTCSRMRLWFVSLADILCKISLLMKFDLGRIEAKSLETNLDLFLKFRCENLLCYNQLTSSEALVKKQVVSIDLIFDKFTTYTFPFIVPVSLIEFVSKTLTWHWLLRNITGCPLSYSWLMLCRLCFNPSTNTTLLKDNTFPYNVISSSFFRIFISKDNYWSIFLWHKFFFSDISSLFLVICLEHPLSRYQIEVVVLPSWKKN